MRQAGTGTVHPSRRGMAHTERLRAGYWYYSSSCRAGIWNIRRGSFVFVCSPREMHTINCTYHTIRVDEGILCQLRVLNVVLDFKRAQSRVRSGSFNVLTPSAF